ncbi:preprotein translocase subunit SecE [Fusibacter paucivorans]|uniref:Protein translocase subunit SecE n=1 Tax=Fusibacter paucivorans TaxID=76009 RepID=A0ABS5PVI4_9FIRM|nr:preprotein translocase subunit SecE [Fusibacter paucivorans]MBS7528706.1 preprotein translocase subunit SecE [Fusibacter paucivorans]
MASSNVKKEKQSVSKMFRNIKSEVKKVTWPTKEDVWQYTLVVLAMCLITSVAIGVLDAVFKFLFNLFA